MTRLLGLDLGGTHIKAAVLEDGHLVDETSTPTLSERGGAPAVLRRMAALAHAAGDADTVGVAVPGLFDESGRGVLLPNLHGEWRGQPIAAILEDALGRPVALVNDGHAFALAESRLGAGRGAETVMCVVCGTGIGGGLVLGGRLHLGPKQRAGEFGHHTVHENGKACNCGNRGCLEQYAGARAIAAAAETASFDEAVEAARAGDVRAREALARAGQLIGLALANVLIYVCPDRVVIGGGMAAAGPLVLDPLRRELELRARVAPLEQIEIIVAELGASAGAIGAALYASTIP